MADLPSAQGVVATTGTVPLNPFQKALQDAWAIAKAELDSKAVRDQAVAGIFGFLEAEFLPADPILAAVEPFVEKLAEIGSK